MKALGAYGFTWRGLVISSLRALRSTLTICVVALLVIAWRQGGFDEMKFAEVRWRNPIFLFLGLLVWEAWCGRVKSTQPPVPRGAA